MQCGIFPDAEEDSDYHALSAAAFDDSTDLPIELSLEDELQKLVNTCYLASCDTFQERMKFIGGATPVVSKFGISVKTKNEKTKRRLILDSKESRATGLARKNQRIMLPDVIDLVSAVQKCMDSADSLQVDI